MWIPYHIYPSQYKDKDELSVLMLQARSVPRRAVKQTQTHTGYRGFESDAAHPQGKCPDFSLRNDSTLFISPLMFLLFCNSAEQD